MHKLTLLFFMVMAISGSAQAGEIPGYVGAQTFRLSDDADYEQHRDELITAVKKINIEGARAGQSDGTMDGAEAGKTSANPGDLTGPNYKPKINHSKVIMEKAFADGYNYKYRQYFQLELNRN